VPVEHVVLGEEVVQKKLCQACCAARFSRRVAADEWSVTLDADSDQQPVVLRLAALAWYVSFRTSSSLAEVPRGVS
jgi:hypothetical protein